jgi:hypothetical protein
VTRLRPFGRGWGRLAKTAFLTAALGLIAAPAVSFAGPPEGVPPNGVPVLEGVPPVEPPPEPAAPPYTGTENPGTGRIPADTPPGYNGMENPGLSHQPDNHEARALGRDECQDFKQNFGENKSQFGRCIAAVATALRTDATPQEACAAHQMSHRRQRGERRSDFSACVVSARRALREQRRGS